MKAEAASPEGLTLRDVLVATCLFAGLALLYALTRSQWLDDWDSINLALALDDFDLPKHQPHPPGYPIHVGAAKLLRAFAGGHAAALTLLSALAGGAVASLFYILVRRQLELPIALCATLVMALSPLFWLQSGLALTDMFGMLFVLAFLLVEGAAPQSARGDLARRVACGVIAGLSVGARPHYTLLILAYWCIRSTQARSVETKHVVTALLAFAAGAALWLIPAAMATGGFDIYFDATVGQFKWRFDKPGASILGSHIGAIYLFDRAVILVGWLGQAFAPMHLPASEMGKRTALALLVIVPYVALAWRSPSRDVARPYILASAIYLLMVFIMLPPRHLRYFLPFALIVGWAVAGYVALFRRPAVRAAALVPLLAVTVLPSFFLVGGLAKVPPPVAALDWVRANAPGASLYSDSLERHARFYRSDGVTRGMPKTEADCAELRRRVEGGSPVFSTQRELCGLSGVRVAQFKRDARIHDKHSLILLFAFGAQAEERR